MNYRILVNRIQCKNPDCQQVVESTHRHHFATCKCGRVSADGGRDYLRRLYKTTPENDYEELSQYEEYEGEDNADDD